MKKKNVLQEANEKSNYVFIIDIFNKYSRDNVVYTFYINGREWCIKQVILNWGKPVLSSIEEDKYSWFKIYENLDDAKEYIKTLKQLESQKY